MNALSNLRYYQEVGRKYTTPEFTAQVEDFLDILRDPGVSMYHPVTHIDHVHYKNNFYAYIRDVHGINSPVHQHICLRVNKMFNPSEFNDQWTIVCIPTVEKMTEIEESYVIHQNKGR